MGQNSWNVLAPEQKVQYSELIKLVPAEQQQNAAHEFDNIMQQTGGDFNRAMGVMRHRIEGTSFEQTNPIFDQIRRNTVRKVQDGLG